VASAIDDRVSGPVPARRLAAAVSVWPLAIAGYGTLLPSEVRIEVGDLQLYGYRIALMIAFPWVIHRLARGTIRLILPDILILFAALWMLVAMTSSYGVARGVQSGGIQGFDMIAAYFLARVSLPTPDTVRRLLTLMLPGFMLAAALMAIESLSGVLIVRPAAAALFGDLPAFGASAVDGIRLEQRLGLTRAYGPFPHPILAGIQMSSLLSLYLMSGLMGMRRTLGVGASIFAFFALSSAAIVGLVLNAGLFAYERLQRRVQGLSWRLFAGVVVILALVAQIGSKNGVLPIIIRYLTIDPLTGYYRLLIWEFAGAQVWRAPWLGTGFEGYERPIWMISDSIDAHWLLLAVRFGLPCALALGGATVGALLMLTKVQRGQPLRDRDLSRGLAISLFVMALLMFTVTLWGCSLAWFTLILGAAVSVGQHRPARREPQR
jgi:O-antigen ligase